MSSWWSPAIESHEEGWMARRSARRTLDVTPSARRLTQSLRHIGYDFTAAAADIVDNSVAAGARRIDVDVRFDGPRSYVFIGDDGVGMTEGELNEALRFGTRRDYRRGELGRFGLGLKTASISQCRRLTVVTRHSRIYARVNARCLDLDGVAETDRWEVVEPESTTAIERAERYLWDGPGTVVVWEMLDRVLPNHRPEGGWARRRLESLASKTSDYLGMVFHRFIEGEVPREPITIAVNGAKIRPWNPFAPGEDRSVLPAKRFEVAAERGVSDVWLRSFVLPPRDRFSNPVEFERMSGPLKWNRQQGLYIYRADRMIQSGGWCGVRAADEHTKLARASLDFQTDLDSLFQVNVAKMRVTLPPQLRTLVEAPLQDLCHRAEAVYRREPSGEVHTPETSSRTTEERSRPVDGAGLALRAAAMEIGEYQALSRILDKVRERSPHIAEGLGWQPGSRRPASP
jgi:Histidine kinase-, DNA gyrase B-, and HSP90-like ATPase